MTREEFDKEIEAWFARVNQEFSLLGAPAINPEKENILFEKVSETELYQLVICNCAFAIAFMKRVDVPNIVSLHLNRGEDRLSVHKTAILVNVLTRLEIPNFERLQIGLPFEIIDSEIVVSENID